MVEGGRGVNNHGTLTALEVALTQLESCVFLANQCFNKAKPPEKQKWMEKTNAFLDIHLDLGRIIAKIQADSTRSN